MAHRASLLFLAAASPLLLICLVTGGGWAVWGMALLAAGFPVALSVLGAARGGRLGPLGWVLGVLAALLAGGLAALVGLHAAGGWSGDVPLSFLVLLATVWLAPLALVPWAYAATFDGAGLRPGELERLRETVAGDRERR